MHFILPQNSNAGSELRSRPGPAIPFPLMKGNPRDFDTELYGETTKKDSWTPRLLWPTSPFRVNSREVRLPDILVSGPTFPYSAFIRSCVRRCKSRLIRKKNHAVFQGPCPGGSSGFALERKFKISCCFPKGSASLFLLET